jgi:hypothetical protein
MTPQSEFMIVAAIAPERETELRGLLDAMNVAPGRVDPDNALMPFGRFEQIHVARFLILDDLTTGDIRAHGVKPETYPLYLAFLGDIDGDVKSFLADLVARAGGGLRRLFACCSGFSPTTDLLCWMLARLSPALACYVNTRGRTVRQVREEAALRDSLEQRLAEQTAVLETMSPPDLHAELRRHVAMERMAGRLTLSDPDPTPTGWRIANLLHLVGMPALVLLLSPLLALAAPFYLWQLRRLEKTDPEIHPTVDQTYSETLALSEDHDVTNSFSAIGSLKPGLLRYLTVVGVLLTVDYAARHLARPGRLGRIRSIHFARWTFVEGRRRMAFFSNYDGSVESYMDDFINKTGFGLNVSFSNGVGYPRTNWLALDGCADEGKYKEFLRRHTIPTQVWYKASPGLTAIDMERNTRIRRGIEAASLSDEEARTWLALL